jgi:hypothetical protein
VKSIRNVSSVSSSNPGSVYSIQKGKIPPQAVDLEEVVLGAMMIDKKGVDEVIDILHRVALIISIFFINLVKN